MFQLDLVIYLLFKWELLQKLGRYNILKQIEDNLYLLKDLVWSISKIFHFIKLLDRA